MSKYKKLSRNEIKKLEPGARMSEHGIAVERTRHGDLRWSVNVMVDGRRIHRVIGMESAGVTREQAERAIEAFRTKALEDRLNLPVGRKTHRSFAEAASEYLVKLKAGQGKDIGNKTRHLDDQLVPFFGSYRINGLKSSDVEAYSRSRMKHVKQATVNRELATLSHLLNRCRDWRWIKADDVPSIVKGPEARKPIAVLSEKQVKALLTAAKADIDCHTYLFVAIGLNAAMRHSEIVRAKFANIDFTLRRIHIPMAKAGERDQPITASLAAILASARREAIDSDGWIFPAKSTAHTEVAKRSHRPSMEYGFKRAVLAAGLDPSKVTPHVMRHTAITRLVQAGIDLPTIQKVSGHKTLSMVLRYTHVETQHVDNAMLALDAA